MGLIDGFRNQKKRKERDRSIDLTINQVNGPIGDGWMNGWMCRLFSLLSFFLRVPSLLSMCRKKRKDQANG